MFELDKVERHRQRTEAAKPSYPLPPLPDYEKAAFLLWSEHCIECAAPDCYRTCDLYVRRPDGRCRRFEFGMGANESFTGDRGPGVEISFNKWAKLEARANVRLMDRKTLVSVEAAAGSITRVLDSIGGVIAKVVRDERWSYLGFAVSERLNAFLRSRDKDERPDYFLLDLYNPTSKTMLFSLTIAVVLPSEKRAKIGMDSIPRPFQRALRIAPGHFRELVPYRDFRDIVESRLPFNIALTPQDSDRNFLVVRSLDLVRLSEPGQGGQAQQNTKGVKRDVVAKCVVFDLDNTLWEGTLLEDEKVRLREGVRELLRILDERGILISIASKNDHEQVSQKLRELDIEEYFVFPRINWGPKSENIKQIAKDIDIGLDTFVFVDDNPFELEEVGTALAMVECLSVESLSALTSHPRLQGSKSAEAKTRRKMYREAMIRAEEQASFGDDYRDFLRSCEIRLTIRREREEDVERIVELVQRTNQLNFSGHKYGRTEIMSILADSNMDRHVLICEDKFGSYGTVGFCISSRADGRVIVHDFMLSCRVQGKFVESALFEYLCSKDFDYAQEIAVEFKRTGRNGPAQQVLAALGFDMEQEGPLVRPVLPGTFAVDFIEVSNS